MSCAARAASWNWSPFNSKGVRKTQRWNLQEARVLGLPKVLSKGILSPLEFSLTHTVFQKGFQHARSFQRAAEIPDLNWHNWFQENCVILPVNQSAIPLPNAKLLAKPKRNRYLTVFGEANCGCLGEFLHALIVATGSSIMKEAHFIAVSPKLK